MNPSWGYPSLIDRFVLDVVLKLHFSSGDYVFIPLYGDLHQPGVKGWRKRMCNFGHTNAVDSHGHLTSKVIILEPIHRTLKFSPTSKCIPYSLVKLL